MRKKDNKKTKSGSKPTKKPTIIPRSEHSVSRTDISENTLKVLYHLKKCGFTAYLVGGGVRDLLLRRVPKDFDIVTNAHPEEIKRSFKNSRLIGKRFRLAHVFFGREIIEVATFRATSASSEPKKRKHSEHGIVMRDNVYGTIDEDVWRRDFTVNALYYNIDGFSIVDYTNGMEDLNQKLIRIIGDPEKRYTEDPVRILRAVRFAAKLDFKIHKDTEAAIETNKALLTHISPARIFEEVLKLFHGGRAYSTYELLQKYDLISHLFPIAQINLEKKKSIKKTLLGQTLLSTDQRINEGKPVTPAFLFAAFLWEPLNEYMEKYQSDGLKFHAAQEKAMKEVIHTQIQTVSIPRRFTSAMQEIWLLQSRFEHRSPKKAKSFLHHRRFRAAYDFLVLRSVEETELKELADWWTEFQECDESGQQKMLKKVSKKNKPKK